MERITAQESLLQTLSIGTQSNIQKSAQDALILKAALFETTLGTMLAISDTTALYLLEFTDRKKLREEIQRLRHATKAVIVLGSTEPLRSIESEIHHYFNGTLKQFNTPIRIMGTSFQQSVWQQLLKIPTGETRSYTELAHTLNKPKAHRAVAQANATNQLAIIIPCHRVIYTNGSLGGYAASVTRKKWLLEHEAYNKN